MGLSLLAGCDNEKQQIFKEAEKDLEQGSYEYALDEFTTSVNNGVKPAVSYRGIGICQLRLGNYDDAITAFTSALGEEKVSKSMARDLYLYRATARLQAGYLDDAMADCQVLAQNYEMDADAWFLTGKVALEMDVYDETIQITIPVTNTGTRAGAEIVQLYIGDKESSLPRPLKELKGFSKVSLAPGETKVVSFSISKDALSFFDDTRHEWIAEPGKFEVFIAASATDIKSRLSFDLK